MRGFRKPVGNPRRFEVTGPRILREVRVNVGRAPWYLTARPGTFLGVPDPCLDGLGAYDLRL